MNQETLNNVRRLAYALYCTTGSPAGLQQLARALRYDLAQLKQDIADLETYTAEKVAQDRGDSE